ncbi:MAG: hypothetical protein JNK85_25515 [Verrucomicrobiales bacterium]|nr:hypothetical protein [Verrucomicrobiales bacterium]
MSACFRLPLLAALLSSVLACEMAWRSAMGADPVPVATVLAQLDPSTGAPKEAGREFTLRGVVGARLVLPDSKTVAFVLNGGEPALMVFAASPTPMADLLPRNEVTLKGKLGAGPLGGGLELADGTVSLLATNKAFGNSEPRGAGFMADATSLAGRYVQITNVTFAGPKFDASGAVRVRSLDGAEATVRVGKAAAGREVPAGAQDVFGFVLKTTDGWQVVAARSLTVERREMLNLATKHTCITCHNPDMKVVGPAYREVAAKYRDDSEASGKLIAQMRTGGSGKWGTVPMLPFDGKIPTQEMQRLADWILGYRWDAIFAD